MKIYLLCIDPDGPIDEIENYAFLTAMAANAAKGRIVNVGSIAYVQELEVTDLHHFPWVDEIERESDPNDLLDIGGRGVEPR